MSAHSLATRYAKSLIEIAQDKGKLDEVFNDVKSIEGILKGSREIQLVFRSPIIPADKKLNIIKQLFEGKISDVIYTFLVLVIKKGREAHLLQVFEAFIFQYNIIKEIMPVKLTSAVKLDPAMVQNMVNSLKAKENLKTVQLKEVIDETMIGGFILQYDDKMIDGSVRKNLAELKSVVEDNTYIKKYS
jgi:F-type H+-transporting ATPase subunit delta